MRDQNLSLSRAGSLAGLLVFALIGPAGARAAQPPPPPPDPPPDAVPPLELLVPGELPVWISRAAAVDDAGQVRWDLFPPGFPDELRRQLDRPDANPWSSSESGCLRTVVSDGTPPAGSMDEVVGSASAILRGRVSARVEGFAGDLPANLLTITVEETIRDSSALSTGPELYVIYPRGRFTFAGVPLCNGLAGFGPVPAVGDRMLLLPREGPVDRNRRVLSPLGEEVFVESRDGLWASEQLWDRDEIRALPSLEALEALVRAKISGDPAGRPFDRAACTPDALVAADPFGALGPTTTGWSTAARSCSASTA